MDVSSPGGIIPVSVVGASVTFIFITGMMRKDGDLW